MMEKIVIVLTALVLLSGCGATTDEMERRDAREKQTVRENDFGPGRTVARNVTLPDGSKVVCVIWDGNQAGSISCDWDNHAPR